MTDKWGVEAELDSALAVCASCGERGRLCHDEDYCCECCECCSDCSRSEGNCECERCEYCHEKTDECECERCEHCSTNITSRDACSRGDHTE